MKNLVIKVCEFDYLKIVKEFFQKYNVIIRDNIYKYIPYFIITFVSFFACIFMFNKGYYEGHDSIFHHTQIMSYYNSLISGDYVGYISNSVINNFGSSIRMFYSSFSHTVTALIGKFIIPLGYTLTSAMKVVNFLTFLFSGIFAYWLGLAVFKQNKLLAVTLAIAYMANPYKFTDVYIRQAYAENFAATFIPLFFYSIHLIIHEDKPDLKSYMILALSTGIMLLSHYVTALFSVCFAVIYILIKGKYLFKKIKQPTFYLYAFAAVICVVIAFLPKAIPLIIQDTEAVNLRLFLDVQGTTIDDIIMQSTRSELFFSFGADKERCLTVVKTMAGGLVGSMILYEITKKKYLAVLPLDICFIALAIIFGTKYKAPGQAVFVILTGLSCTILLLIQGKKQSNNKYIGLYDLLAWGALAALSLTLILSTPIWKVLPSFFYKIQFPWRLWFYGVLFCDIFVIGLVSYANKLLKSSICIFPVLAIICYGSSQCLRTSYCNEYNMENTVENVDMDTLFATGWQYEYLSETYWQWESRPETNLYYTIRTWLYNSQMMSDEVYVPDIKGGSEAKDYVYEYAKDGASFIVEEVYEESAMVYMPLFYYEGYKATLTTIDGEKTNLDVKETCGLVSFEITDPGTINVKFVGTSLMNTTMLLTKLTIPLVTLGSFVFLIRRKMKKDEEYILSARKL